MHTLILSHNAEISRSAAIGWIALLGFLFAARKGFKMKIKEGCTASSSDFWYDLTKGGYLNPEEILENKEDVEAVKNAISVLTDFEDSCEVHNRGANY